MNTRDPACDFLCFNTGLRPRPCRRLATRFYALWKDGPAGPVRCDRHLLDSFLEIAKNEWIVSKVMER